MNKTREFEIAEAYARGWNEALKAHEDSMIAIEEWQSRPEWDLVQAMNRFVKNLALEMTGQKDFRVSK